MLDELQPLEIVGFSVWAAICILLVVATASLGRVRRTLSWYSLLLATLLSFTGFGTGIYGNLREWRPTGGSAFSGLDDALLFIAFSSLSGMLAFLFFLGAFIAQALRFVRLHRRILELEALYSTMTAEAGRIDHHPSPP